MATSLQRGASAFQSRLPDTRRVRGKDQGARRSVPAGDGPDRCGMWGLRAPARRITVPQGAITSSSKRSGRLKLKVVRRKWAGQGVLVLLLILVIICLLYTSDAADEED